MPYHGIIFDLDGTLIDSRLDFDAMRREMGFPHRQPILETLEAMPPGPDRERCLQILHAHERRGAETATIIPGAIELLAELTERELARAILTRNSRAMTELSLTRLELQFSLVLCREDAPPKPDPAGLLQICQEWQVHTDDVLFVGDFHFDLLAGRAAGIRTVLYAPDGPPDYAHEANWVVPHLAEIIPLLAEC